MCLPHHLATSHGSLQRRRVYPLGLQKSPCDLIEIAFPGCQCLIVDTLEVPNNASDLALYSLCGINHKRRPSLGVRISICQHASAIPFHHQQQMTSPFTSCSQHPLLFLLGSHIQTADSQQRNACVHGTYRRDIRLGYGFCSKH